MIRETGSALIWDRTKLVRKQFEGELEESLYWKLYWQFSDSLKFQTIEELYTNINRNLYFEENKAC